MNSSLHVIHPRAGAIDIGSSELYCNTFQSDEVEVFAYRYEELEKLVSFFIEAGVETLALEATGVYWLPVFEALEAAGLEVYMVNGAHVKQLPGRKSDIADAVWLRTLHQYGLLKAGFVPEASIRSLRSYVRIRENHIKDGAREVSRMHKALDLMSLKPHQVLTQIHGKSGLAILDAILTGERDPAKLVALTDARVQKSKADELIKSLRGNYRKEHLFLLEQALKSWRFHQTQILACDKRIEEQLLEMTVSLDVPDITDKPKPIRHHKPQIPELHTLLLMLTGGKNPTQLDGINDQTLMKLIAHCGLDFSKWKNEKHFTSYASLTPCRDRSGKQKRKRYKQGNKELKNIFTQLANSIAKTQTDLGEFYRHLKGRRGPKIAMKALARKIAERFYRIMRHGTEYTSRGIEHFQQNFKEQQLNMIRKRIKSLGIDNHELIQLLQ